MYPECALHSTHRHDPHLQYLTTWTYAVDNLYLHIQGQSSRAYEQKFAYAQWAWSMGVAMMANKNALFVTFVGHATRF